MRPPWEMATSVMEVSRNKAEHFQYSICWSLPQNHAAKAGQPDPREEELSRKSLSLEDRELSTWGNCMKRVANTTAFTPLLSGNLWCLEKRIKANSIWNRKKKTSISMRKCCGNDWISRKSGSDRLFWGNRHWGLDSYGSKVKRHSSVFPPILTLTVFIRELPAGGQSTLTGNLDPREIQASSQLDVSHRANYQKVRRTQSPSW